MQLLLLFFLLGFGTASEDSKCVGINQHLAINDACRCYNYANAEGRPGLVWVGCTRVEMPKIYHALSELPANSSLYKLWIWDTILPIVPVSLFQSVSVQELVIESSYTGDFMPGALQVLKTDLKILDLRNNLIREIHSAVFEQLTRLESLDLSGNAIEHLKVDSFGADLQNLETMSLYMNNIAAVEPGTFKGMQKLQRLNLAQNKLTEIKSDTFADLNSLEYLNLGQNHISKIAPDAFSSLHALRVLNLENNGFSTLALSGLPNLQKLYLNENEIGDLAELKLTDLPSVRSINLDKNKLKSINRYDSLIEISTLRAMSMTNNQIDSVHPEAMVKLIDLETLSLQQNLLEQIPDGLFVTNEKLKNLFLSQNRLSSLGASQLMGLKSLEILSLAHNAIESVDSKSFQGLGKLRKLFINDNNIGKLDNGTFKPVEKTLVSVDLSDNPWLCNCEAVWMVSWLEGHRGVVMNMDELSCAQPRPGFLPQILTNLRQPCSLAPGPAQTTQNSWIVTLGIVLGILSCLILCAVIVLYLKDQKLGVRVGIATLVDQIPPDCESLINSTEGAWRCAKSAPEARTARVRFADAPQVLG